MKTKYTHLALILFTVIFANGCSIMSPIGKQDFACPNEKKGGVCAGPRTIYELTNSRANLEHLGEDDDFDGYVITENEDGETVAVRHNKTVSNNTHDHTEANNQAGARAVIINDKRHQYQPRDLAQQSGAHFQSPRVIPQQRTTMDNQNPFHQWPANQEPLAPEPLSVLEPPKVMRILFASYKDSHGNLNLPGYLYVQVEPETWAFGEAANLRPQRVIPTEMIRESKQKTNQQEYRQQGVSPLEYIEK